MEEFLAEETIGYLGLSAADEPYVVPLNYAYTDGKILFHCALEGKKLDIIRRNPRVCFTVARQTGEVRRHTKNDPCHVNSDSVICYGTARIIEEMEERTEVLNAFHGSYETDPRPIKTEVLRTCYAVEIAVSEMTGRREQGRKCTYWRYRFEGEED
jgi:nitroimidazol reductase NimA-like FMN-containing flavoprotein (pyridoxamine 5'-phosphate oxidase superfamily)